MNNLFCEYELESYLNNKIKDMMSKIDSESSEYFANVNYSEYLNYLLSEYQLYVPQILEDQITYNQGEQKIERYNKHYTQINVVDGIAIYVNIPYLGEQELFKAKPSSWCSIKPNGYVNEYNIVLFIGVALADMETFDINSYITQQLSSIKTYLGFVEKDITNYNKTIRNLAEKHIQYKLNSYKKIDNFLKNIPYKLERNENAQLTYKVPNVERKIQFQKPKINKKNMTPEPELETKEYNEIIEICSNMSKIMERSPNDFASMNEETIRSHFLVQLNGQYEGQATGETFNSSGKTDILIRSDNQNVFIAECKFWKGKKGFLATIDQLLGYVTYRDTKTAIFVFVKNKDFTKVCEDMKSVTAEHSNFVRYIDSYKPQKDTSTFRCEFKNKNDEEKHFYITVMAFCIPHI